MPEVDHAVNTLEKRLRRAQIQRLILLWFTVILFLLVGLLFWQQHDNLVAGCERAHARDREMARLQLHAGAQEDRSAALQRANADCGRLFSLLP
jgi:hypothetical protein